MRTKDILRAIEQESIAYKGYLIRYSVMGGTWRIEKDKFHISYAKSVEEAKKTIDMLVD